MIIQNCEVREFLRISECITVINRIVVLDPDPDPDLDPVLILILALVPTLVPTLVTILILVLVPVPVPVPVPVTLLQNIILIQSLKSHHIATGRRDDITHVLFQEATLPLDLPLQST